LAPSVGHKPDSEKVYSDGYVRNTFSNMGFVKEAEDIGSRLKGLVTGLKVKLLKRYFDACLEGSELTKEMFEIYVTSLDSQIVNSLELFYTKLCLKGTKR